MNVFIALTIGLLRDPLLLGLLLYVSSLSYVRTLRHVKVNSFTTTIIIEVIIIISLWHTTWKGISNAILL